MAKIHYIVLADRRLEVREIAGAIGVSKDRMGYILHEILKAVVTVGATLEPKARPLEHFRVFEAI